MRLSVTGAGLVTSMGYGLVGSCAAIRSELARSEAIPDMEVGDGEGEVSPVIGFPASTVAGGFEQFGAWIQLAASALDDIRHHFSLPEQSDVGFWRRTGMVVLLPIINWERFFWTEEDQPNALNDLFIKPLLERTGLLVPPQLVTGLSLGCCGLAQALRMAEKSMQTGRLDRLLIVAADSYMDMMTLKWLSEVNRLKTPEQEIGFMPGEAGGCLLVETEQAALARSAEVIGHIGAAFVSDLPRNDKPSEDDMGRKLAEVIINACGPQKRFDGLVMADLNGEEWKAQAWGIALVNLMRKIDLSNSQTVVPSENIGEVGAASSMVSVIMSLFEFALDGAKKSLVWSLSDAGQTAAVHLTAKSK